MVNSPVLRSLYDADYVAWLDQTAQHLQNRDLQNLDWEHLLEEVTDLGREQRRKVKSYLRQLLKHLLLYQYWLAEKPRCERGWREEIDNFRTELEDLLQSRTLGQYAAEQLELTYLQAKRAAAIKSNLNSFPDRCPYSLEQVLNPDWLPE